MFSTQQLIKHQKIVKHSVMAKAILSGLSLALMTASFQSHAMTIEQAWKAAKAYDPDYQKAQIGEKIGETNVRSSRSDLLPDLTLSANSNWYEHNDNTTGYSVTLNQVLWDSSKWSKLDASEALAMEARLKVQQAHNELAEKLITAYLNLAQAQGDFRLAQQKLVEGEKQLNIIEQNFRAGKSMSTELEDAKANQVDIDAELLAKQSLVEERKAGLAALISSFPEQVDEISTSDLNKPQMAVQSQDEWLTLAKNNSPELLAAKQKLKSVEFGQEQAESGYYPTVTGQVSYSDNDRSSQHDLNAGITLSLPIDLNGSTKANVDLSKLEVMQAKQDVRSVEIRISEQIQTRFNQIDFDWQRVEMAQQQVNSRERALKSKQAVYNAGLATADDVIDAHNRLYDSKNSLQSLLYQYWLHRVALLKSVGQLNDDTIKHISRALQS
ncbi:Type I secretion outer membrane protein, TolC precursor [Photobacterium marinum]|uniref:Type I secretion outer membrane protein, TolC n=2 Tax=Photobacterium marinum TaxID=1056511 RepID=L8JGI0_9GAMM|nr:Type I secretion outer membrane protein, TolC precursor [Photobacterium marinum]